MMEVSKITYEQIKNNKSLNLLSALEEITKETNAHDQKGYKEELWEWQYKKLPSKESLIYVALDEGKIIGYYHIPTYEFIINKQNYRIGNVQSVAILKKYRKKAIFEKLSKFANLDAEKQLDLIYTFPNDKSIHTFKKYNNYKLISTLPTYLYLIDPKKLINSKFKFPGDQIFSNIIKYAQRFYKTRLGKNDIIQLIDINNDENINLFENFSNSYENHLLRNKEFLNWKYVDTPKSKYFCYGLKSGNELKASIIAKIDQMFSNDGLIIMDYAYKSVSDIKRLISNLNELDLGLSKDLSFVLLCSLNRDIRELTKCGYIKIPKKINPRRLNLLVKICNKEIKSDLENKDTWLVTMSDWDVL
tara:strand:- start:155 stop:1234 length:1080 start_codon:yes stop_codon:yes gene_type:complete